MKKEIVFKNTLITVFALFIFAVIAIVITNNYNTNQNKENIIRTTEIYKNTFIYKQDNDYSAFSNLSEELKKTTRITIIKSDGTVLNDSHSQADLMENHISRPEIQAALNDNCEVYIRESDTINIKMMYYAEKIYNNDNSDFVFLRIAININEINNYVYSVLSIIILVVSFVVLVSMFVTVQLNKKILSAFQFVGLNLEKINKGSYKSVMPNFKHDELNNAVIGLNDIQQNINSNIKRLNEETEKLDFVLDNIEQGIITLDGKLDIILINPYAQKIFNIEKDIAGKNLLYTGCGNFMYTKISEIVNDKKPDSFEFEYNGKILKISVSIKKHILIILEDVTAIKKMEMLRSDFFANASHELKTPITSIAGFSELLKNDINSENISKYVSYILKDSKRMLRLIEDMLKLSKLDTNIEQGKKQDLDLSLIANEVKDSLSVIAKNKNITVSINGKANFFANRDNIYELMENLVSNAIRYNTKNGKVDINLYTENKKTVIEVVDDGIGIDDIYQDRIFERFYRVDKGRSKNTGGTGLGLSIVKHIVSLYGGKIDLYSRLDEGTTVKVIL